MGLSMTPTQDLQQLIDGKWESNTSSISMAGDSNVRWTALHSSESIIIFVGPISEKATELRVGIPFTTQWFPNKMHWVFSPILKIVKKKEGVFVEVKQGSEQEEQIQQ
jgi:hypothetical protein